jgi:hypothetical protein
MHQDLNAVYNADFISQNLLISYHVIEKTDKYARALTESQAEVNKQNIWITVEFHSNFPFVPTSLEKKTIDLIANHISATYIPTKAGLQSKCREIQTLQIYALDDNFMKHS